MRIRHFWGVLNSLVLALALWGGYASLNLDQLRYKNTDAAACLTILLVMPGFAILSVGYSLKRWSTSPLKRPSWNRNPFNWWRDPLQSLFVSTCVFVATAIGSAIRKPIYGSVGFWTMGVYACFGIGLSLGQFLVYRIYRHRIAAN